MSDLVGNLEDRFSRVAAQLVTTLCYFYSFIIQNIACGCSLENISGRFNGVTISNIARNTVYSLKRRKVKVIIEMTAILISLGCSLLTFDIFELPVFIERCAIKLDTQISNNKKFRVYSAVNHPWWVSMLFFFDRSGGIMTTVRPELPYPCSFQAKTRDEFSRRGKLCNSNVTVC